MEELIIKVPHFVIGGELAFSKSKILKFREELSSKTYEIYYRGLNVFGNSGI